MLNLKREKKCLEKHVLFDLAEFKIPIPHLCIEYIEEKLTLQSASKYRMTE